MNIKARFDENYELVREEDPYRSVRECCEHAYNWTLEECQRIIGSIMSNKEDEHQELLSHWPDSHFDKWTD